MPEVAQKVMQLSADPDVSLGEVVAAVESDPGIAAEIVRYANSAIYSTMMPARDLREAAFRLGLTEVHDLTMAMAMLAAFRSPAERALGLQERSVLSGNYCRGLGRLVGLSAGETYLAGLMSELGALAISAVDEEYVPLRKGAIDLPSLEEAERRRYGASSREIGADLLEANGFPPELVAAIAGREQAPALLRAIVGFAREAAGVLVDAGKTGDLADLLEHLVDAAHRHGLEAEGQQLIDLALEASADTSSALTETLASG